MHSIYNVITIVFHSFYKHHEYKYSLVNDTSK